MNTPVQSRSSLIQLDGVGDLPPRISRLTGIAAEDLQSSEAMSPRDLADVIADLYQQYSEAWFVIHYARFELSFLNDLLAKHHRPFDLKSRTICTHRLARVLLPGLSSYSLRAVAGYLGCPLDEKKRASAHLEATVFVWRKLSQILSSLGPDLHTILVALQKDSRPMSISGVPVRDRSLSGLRNKRLSLPKNPGIYRFLDKTGRTLYVGKAKNLHARVNSYFRGRKSKGARLNEMLAQADDISYELAESELAALLAENRAIKHYNPPYNRQLKAYDRQIVLITWQEFNDDVLEKPSSVVNIASLSSSKALDFCVTMVRALLARQCAAEGGLLLQEKLGFSVALSELEKTWQRLQSILEPMLGAKSLQSFALAYWQLQRQDLRASLRAKRDALRLARVGTQKVQELTDDEDLDESVDEPETWVWTAESLASYCLSQLNHVLRQAYRSRWYVRLQKSRILLCDKTGQWLHCQYNSQGWQIKSCQARPEHDWQPDPEVYRRRRSEQLSQLTLQHRDGLAIVYSQMRQALLEDRSLFVETPGAQTLENDALMNLLL